MLGLIKGFFGWIKKLFGLLVPAFAKAADVRKMGPKLRWFLHFMLLALVLAGLGALNYFLDLERVLRAPLLILRRVWLPLVFLLVYSLCWLGWWLWKLLSTEESTTDYPDIDLAWSEAIRALTDAGIEITETPIFLVLGRPRGREEGLFQAAQLHLAVTHAPQRGDSPLHVYANRDGIYVTCAGASTTGKLASLLSAQLAQDVPQPRLPRPTPEPSERLSQLPPVLGRTLAAELAVNTEEEAAPNLLLEEPSTYGQATRQHVNLWKNTAEVQTCNERLEHLCRLIARDRAPYCPINGILVLLPLAGLDTDEDTYQTAAVCREDLTTAREVFQVNCPTFALVCDLEHAPGFMDLIRRVPLEQRLRRLGRQYPLIPDVQPSALAEVYRDGVAWITKELLPGILFKLFDLEGPGGNEDPSETAHANARLYRFLAEMRRRNHGLTHVLTRGMLPDAGTPPLLGGCYLAATGNDPEREQAFVASVFRQLTESQNYVSWTPAALGEDADLLRWSRYGYAAMGLVVVTVATVCFFYWPYL